jgi:hypothetical protein
MKPSWRPVLFLVCPFINWRVPMGILVERDGVLEWYGRRMLESDVGGPAALQLVKTVAANMGHDHTFDRLPEMAGPQVELGRSMEFPDEVGPLDTAAWLREHWLKGVER